MSTSAASGPASDPTEPPPATATMATPAPMVPWRAISDLCDFEAHVLHTQAPTVVAFEDRDCDHCRAQRHLLTLAWGQLGWRLATCRVDARRLPVLAEHYRILGCPTLLVFAGGDLVARIPGRQAPSSLTERLAGLPGITASAPHEDPTRHSFENLARPDDRCWNRRRRAG